MTSQQKTALLNLILVLALVLQPATSLAAPAIQSPKALTEESQVFLVPPIISAGVPTAVRSQGQVQSMFVPPEVSRLQVNRPIPVYAPEPVASRRETQPQELFAALKPTMASTEPQPSSVVAADAPFDAVLSSFSGAQDAGFDHWLMDSFVGLVQMVTRLYSRQGSAERQPEDASLDAVLIETKLPLDLSTGSEGLKSVSAQTGSWAVGNTIGLNCNTKIHEGPADSYFVHTVVPVDNYQVYIKDGPRFADGQTWWDIDREAVSGDPGDGTGWVSQQQSEGASCSGDGGGGGDGPDPINWAVDELIGLCEGTAIRHGPELAVHTIVPQDDYTVRVTGGPRSYDGQIWWDTSRRAITGDPGDGTGWVSQQQTEAACGGAPTDPGRVALPPLTPELRALLEALGLYQEYLRFVGDPISVSTGTFTHGETDVDVPGKAGFDLVLKRVYNSRGERDGVFGTGWSSLLDMSLRIANDGSIDVRYPDGRGALFRVDGSVYVADQEGLFDTLTYDEASGFELTTQAQIRYQFGQKGFLLSLQDRHGNTITLARDGDGHVTSITDSGNRVFALSYSGDRISSITDPVGRILQYGYDDGRLVTFTNANNGVHRYTYDGNLITTLVDPEGITYLQNIYDGDGRVVEQLDAAGTHSYWIYDDGSNRTTFTDNLSRNTVYEFDSEKRITRIVDALGNAETFVYDSDDNVTSYTNKLGDVWTYTFDNRGNQLTETDPLGGVTTTTYNGTNDVTSVIDALNRTTIYERNSAGDVTRIERPGGSAITATYDGGGQISTLTDPNGNSTSHEYDGAGNLVKVTDAGGHSTSYGRDGVGRMIRVTDPRGGVTQFLYDGNDNVTRITDALGQETLFAFDGNDSLVQLTDREGGSTSYEYDLNLSLVKETDAEGNVTTHAYDAMYNRISTTDARGNTTLYRYDELDRLIEVEDALGGIQQTGYDAGGRPVKSIDENGMVTSMQYDDLGRMLTQTINDKPGQSADPQTNVTTQYSYDAVGNPVTETDANGNTTSYTYDLLDRLIQEENAAGEATAYRYDAAGNLIQVTNSRGFSTQFTYNADNLLIQITDALSQETNVTYDANHNVVDVTDPHGVVIHQEYNALNRMTAEIRNYQPAQNGNSDTNVVTRYIYNPEGTVATLIDPKGNSTQYRYDGLHRLIEEADAEGGLTTYGIDVVGNLVAVTNANGHTTSFSYDILNRLVSQTDAEGHQQAYAYDAVDNLTSVTNGRGYVTRFQFDSLRRPIKTIDARNGTVTLAYDPMGNVLSIIDQNGHEQSFSYDLVYRLVSETDAEGYVTTYERDENGNRTAIVDGNGNRTLFAFDALDREESMTNAEGETTRYLYDALGNRTALIEADSVVTLYEYDPLYRLAAVVLNHRLMAQADAATNVRYAYTYDANSNLVATRDPLNHVTAFEYDSLNRQVKETNPLANTWQYTYDNVGNLLTRLDANGHLTQYSYNGDNLLTQVLYPDGSAITHAYDANHNHVGMNDGLGTSAWSYDELDRMVTASDSLGRQLAYTFDATGNRTGITYPDGRTVSYGYLANNWLHNVTDPDGRVTSYQRDGVGLTTFVANPNSTVVEMSYDQADRLLSLSTRQTVDAQKTISAFRYTLDAVGQRTQMVAEYGWRQPAQVTTSYKYDGLRRLVRSATSEGASTSYTFDAGGNRLQQQTNDDAFSPKPFDAQTLTYAYNAANQLLSVREDRTQGKKTEIQTDFYTYDANGNRTNHSFSGPLGPKVQGTDYSYDYENRLVSALNYQGGQQREAEATAVLSSLGNNLFLPNVASESMPAATDADERKKPTQPVAPQVNRTLTTMAYDGLGRRLAKTYDPKVGGSGAKRTEYTFDGLDPIAEYDQWNGHVRNYYRGDMNRMMAMQVFPSSQSYWYAYDGLGSITGITKDLGQSVHNYRYTDYGAVVPVNGNWTDPHNHYTYTGQEWDEETSLLHFYARDYDPRTGVWMGQDPYRGRAADPLTLHRYGYVAGNPVNYVDVLGYERIRTSFVDAALKGTIPLSIVPGRRSSAPTFISPASKGAIPLSTLEDAFSILGYGNTTFWDSLGWMSAGVTASQRAYWTNYPNLAQNQTLVIRRTPNLTPYFRTKPGVSALAAQKLASLPKDVASKFSFRGQSIPAPAVKSTATVLAAAGVFIDGALQYHEDTVLYPELTPDQRAGRVSATVAASALTSAVALIAVGAATTAGAPVLLTAAVGFGVVLAGNWAWNQVKDPVFDFAGLN